MPKTLTEWVTLGGVIVGAANFVMLLVVKNAVLGSEIRIMKWAEDRFMTKEVFRFRGQTIDG